MALKAYVSAEEFGALPEALQGEYLKQEDGGFLLSVESVNGLTLEDTQGLRSALSRERSSSEKASRLAKAFEGMDPKKIRSDLERLEKLEAEDPEAKAQAQFDALRSQLEEQHAEQVGGLEGHRAALERQLRQQMVSRAASEELAKSRGNVELLLPHVEKHIRVEFDDEHNARAVVVGKDGEPLISRKPGSSAPMSIGEFVEGMRTNDVFASNFESQTAGGTGHEGDAGSNLPGGVNPFVKGSFNLTKQMEMLNKNPEMAKSLQDAAASG